MGIRHTRQHWRLRGSGAGQLRNVATATRAEAEACAADLQSACEWGMMNVDVEPDCQALINAVKGKASDLAAEGVIFRDIRQFARLNFTTVVFLSLLPPGRVIS